MKPRKKDIASALLVMLALLGLCAGADETPALPDTTLADAAEAADWPRVRNLLKGGAEANMRQVDGMTALHWAAWHDRMDAATLLIEHGADADASNRYGVTPLSLACQNGNPKLVRALLEAGANAKTSLPGGETVLMIAARTGRIGAVEALLDRRADVNAKDRRGQTAVMWAASEGRADVVSLLIEHGADFQTPLRSGFTPLFFAVREGRTDAVRVLLKAGVDVNEAMRPKSGGGRAPRDGMSPLLLAVENGHFELAVDLLQAGADPNDQRSGFSPLHALTWVRKPNKGDGLDGAPPPSGSGNVTSLQFARRLVEHGADVNARLKRGRSGRGRLNHTGATAFLLAADTADVSYMRLLLELGADPAIPNADDCPPLLAAAGIGTMAPGEEAGTEDEALAAVRLLLELGADVNAVDDNGETAMHGAAYKSLPRMVPFLADHGADINVWNKKNKYGWTPLLIAQGHRVGNFKPAAATIAAIVRAMRDAGVEPPTKPAPRAPRQRNYAPQEKKPRAKQQENP
jgi:ankyrin repeat protein